MELEMEGYKFESISCECKRKLGFENDRITITQYNFSFITMTNSQGIKYTCGCGKHYSSYPAFSTHKRQKHNNEQINGTSIPKMLMPKRGRPSFARPTHSANHTHNYSALTIVQSALLQLQHHHAPILSQPESQPDYSILNLYEDCLKEGVSDFGTTVVEAVRKFNQTLITHTLSHLANTLTQYLVELTSFFLQNLNAKAIKLEWQESKEDTKIQTSLFNKYFHSGTNRQNVAQYASDCNKPFKIFVEVTVALSQYLCKVGLAEATLRVKQ